MIRSHSFIAVLARKIIHERNGAGIKSRVDAEVVAIEKSEFCQRSRRASP